MLPSGHLPGGRERATGQCEGRYWLTRDEDVVTDGLAVW